MLGSNVLFGLLIEATNVSFCRGMDTAYMQEGWNDWIEVVLCMYVCMYCLTSYESLPGGMKDG
jgi:hypothetical protein